MKLSDAIRHGATLRPQGYGSCFVYAPDGACVGSCALGAAYETLYCQPPQDWQSSIGMTMSVINHFGLKAKAAVCPATGETKLITRVIMDLNDRERWSREQIADWLATIHL